ncbi:MAG: hypothetical protein FVQ81_12240 [Candidatus Glassbacteria bacterium]|nr:hypothetical protein [Candidatus Glassbacteria bacterium]
MKTFLIDLLKLFAEWIFALKTFLIDLLKPFAEWIFALVVAVPLPVVRFFFLGMLAVIALWVFSLPAQREKDEDGNDKSWYTDLRVMGIGLLVLQSICYIIL